MVGNKFINLAAIAGKLGVSVDELMSKLSIDKTLNEDEAIEMLRGQLDQDSCEKFETFLMLAGHHVEEISL